MAAGTTPFATPPRKPVLKADDSLFETLGVVEENEIGVYLELPESIAIEAGRLFAGASDVLADVAPIRTKPHITLYQGYMPKEHQAAFFERLEALLAEHPAFEINLRGSLEDFKGYHIFWCAEPSESLQNLHEAILELAQEFRPDKSQRIRVFKAIPEGVLPQVDEYGMNNVKERYNPHITLFYESRDHVDVPRVIADVKPDESRCKFAGVQVCVGNIGPVGNVLNELRRFDLAPAAEASPSP